MSSVYLLSAAPDGPERHEKAHLDLERMRASAQADRFGVHSVVDDPAAAGLILFVETSWLGGYYFERIRKHPVYREFRPKCYLFSAMDKVVPFLPGVFASIEQRWYWQAWTRSGYYPGIREEGAFRYEPDAEPSLLFSFVGGVDTHPMRREIMRLKHPRALLLDTYDEGMASRRGEPGAMTKAEYNERYAEGLRDSAFVLCPRGGGTATFRLFESMLMGRVPVIISDEWVPPEGPDWESFGIRVPEAEIASIPSLLDSLSDRAASMGRAARAAWLDWFSKDAAFHRTVEWCLELHDLAKARTGIRRYAPHLQMLRPYHGARKLAKQLGHGSDAEV